MNNITDELFKSSEAPLKTAKAYKDSLYELGCAFKDAKAKKQTQGLRFKDYCEGACKIDAPIVNAAIKIVENFTCDELQSSTIGALKHRLSKSNPKEKEDDKYKYKTIKLDKDQAMVVESAYEVFCKENNLPPWSSMSYFVEVCAAEYLAQVRQMHKELTGEELEVNGNV